MFFDILKNKNILQTELAQLLGVTQQTISKWCCGKCEPSLNAIIKISETYNIPIENIVLSFRKVG